MKRIKVKEDLKELKSQSSIKKIAKKEHQKLLDIYESPGSPYNPCEDGYLLVVEKSDTAVEIREELGKSFKNILWEGIEREENCFIGVALFNNQFAISVIIPDEEWLDDEWREILQSNL
ncbi:MAG: hypothetical protein U9O87_01515 [Verrucomicrobiota bacterium]|nr:hypothetical protein [Verrucomicrobiota bacterium]